MQYFITNWLSAYPRESAYLEQVHLVLYQGCLHPLSTTLNAYYFFQRGGGQLLRLQEEEKRKEGRYLSDDRIIFILLKMYFIIKHIFALYGLPVLFLPREATRSAVLPRQVVCLSVRLFVRL